MNYPYATTSPYIQAAMSQAVQAIMSGAPLPPNCLVMAMPFQQVPQRLLQLRMNPPTTGGQEPAVFPQQPPYYGPPSYQNPPATHAVAPQQNYNYPIVPYKSNQKSKAKSRQQPHSNVYNSSSFDSYMENLSWSRLFHRPSPKKSKQTNQEETSTRSEKKTNAAKNQHSNSSLSSSSSSSSSTSSTTSDETIRRVSVNSRPSSNLNTKPQTKGSLPFKYSSEFIPGIGKQQQQAQQVKPNDVFIIKKP